MSLTLNDNDPRVIAARASEQQLFEYYGLQATAHYILLPDQGIRLRVLEIGTGKPVEIGSTEPARNSRPIVIVPGNTGDAFPLASLLATFCNPENCRPTRRVFLFIFTNMTIISATPADIPALVPLVNAAYRGEGDKNQKGWTSEGHLISGARTTAAGITELLQPPRSVILKCIDEKTALLGCVHLEKQDDKLYLGMLSVWPKCQSQGIGKHLLAAAADQAKKNNCKNIHITVISARPELIAWYERHGYQRTGEIQPFHHGEKFGIQKQPLELVVLEKPV